MTITYLVSFIKTPHKLLNSKTVMKNTTVINIYAIFVELLIYIIPRNLSKIIRYQTPRPRAPSGIEHFSLLHPASCNALRKNEKACPPQKKRQAGKTEILGNTDSMPGLIPPE